MALLSNLAAVLESLGYGTWGGGTSTNVSIYLNHEPPAPAAVTTLYLLGGPPDTLTLTGDANGERPVQVRRRDPDYAALEAWVEGLYGLWTPWNTYQAYYLTLRAATKPLFAYPQDSNNNFIASFNIRCIQGS